MWYGGEVKVRNEEVSDARLKGMNVYIKANRERGNHDALRDAVDLIPETLIMLYDKEMIPAGIVRG